jgi:hypothetical protein
MTTRQVPAAGQAESLYRNKYLAALVCFVVIAAYFVWLARNGLVEYFNPDDTTNLYQGWIQPYPHLLYTSTLGLWEGEMRPLGKLFYRVIFERFGFTPLPFRVACFALMLANLALLFRLALRVFERLEYAALALLVGCFHGALWSIYASTGTVFDVLCQFFVLLAVLAYARWLEQPRPWWLALVCASTLWAIQSKEMGYAVPLLLLCYGACYGRSVRGVLLGVAPTVVMAGLGVVGMLRNDVLFHHAGYTPHAGWSAYLETTSTHLTMLFYREWPVSALAGLGLLGATLALAVLLRSRAALFGWLFFNVALLPLSLVAARHDGYVLYIPYIGCALYVAAVTEALAGRWRRLVPAVACLLVAAVVVPLQVMQAHSCVRQGFGPGGQSLVRDLAVTAALPGSVGKHRVVLIDDPWAGDQWQPQFIVHLSRGNRDIKILRATSHQPPPVRAGDQVLKYSNHVYAEVPVLQ